jgi:hypothetical protein
MQTHMKLRKPPSSEFEFRLIVVEPLTDFPPQSMRQTVSRRRIIEYTLIGTALMNCLLCRKFVFPLTCIAVINMCNLPDSSQPVVFAEIAAWTASNMDIETIRMIMPGTGRRRPLSTQPSQRPRQRIYPIP